MVDLSDDRRQRTRLRRRLVLGVFGLVGVVIAYAVTYH